MKSTGIVRQVDDLGRIVIPKELRRTMEIESGDMLELFVDKDMLIYRKYKPGCIFCGTVDHLVHFNGKMVCKPCVSNLANESGDQA